MTLTAGQRPRVVLFRHAPIERDTRAKKWALTLDRVGYEVIVLSAEPADAERRESSLAGVRIIHVPVPRTHVEANNARLIANRRRRYPVLAPADPSGRSKALSVRSASLSSARRQAAALRQKATTVRPTSASEAKGLVKFGLKRAEVEARRAVLRLARARNPGQAKLDIAVGALWKEYDKRRVQTGILAHPRNDLPEILDLDLALRDLLVELRPDVLHAHHPFVLDTAFRVRAALHDRGHEAKVVYDARENFVGIPALEQGHARRHAVLVAQERAHIRDCAGVSTVSEPIADVLRDRYALAGRPAVILNTPVLAGDRTGPTVRDEIGLDAQTPLLVYSGTISHARGIDTLVRGLEHLPGVHLVIVSVPHPHPSVPALEELARELGAADRLHVLPPVGQSQLIHYLSGADVAVHPMPGGSPNHDQALPNKLFEYLHAGLPLVVSDARLMANFVTRHEVGQVFTANDARSYATAVRAALDGGKRTGERVGELARTYSWEAQEGAIRAYYESVTGFAGRTPEGELPSLDADPDPEPAQTPHHRGPAPAPAE